MAQTPISLGLLWPLAKPPFGGATSTFTTVHVRLKLQYSVTNGQDTWRK